MALKKQIIFLYLLYFISNKVPEYTEIKDQRIFFHLNNSDASFYAFMKCSNDYEPEEDKPLKFDYQIIEIFYHYFFLNKKLVLKVILSQQLKMKIFSQMNKYLIKVLILLKVNIQKLIKILI